MKKIKKMNKKNQNYATSGSEEPIPYMLVVESY